MTRQEFLEYCLDTYGTTPDYPFEDDCETAVLRHENNRKWYALVMKVSRRKFGIDSDEVIDVVNLKQPLKKMHPTPIDSIIIWSATQIKPIQPLG